MGTSAACELPISVAGAMGFLFFGQLIDTSVKDELPNSVLGFVHIHAFVCISLASYLTARIGVNFAHKLRAATLKKAFAILMLIMGSQTGNEF